MNLLIEHVVDPDMFQADLLDHKLFYTYHMGVRIIFADILTNQLTIRLGKPHSLSSQSTRPTSKNAKISLIIIILTFHLSMFISLFLGLEFQLLSGFEKNEKKNDEQLSRI